MKGQNQDNFADKCMKNDEGYLSHDGSTTLKAWKMYYEKLHVELRGKSIFLLTWSLKGGQQVHLFT